MHQYEYGIPTERRQYSQAWYYNEALLGRS